MFKLLTVTFTVTVFLLVVQADVDEELKTHFKECLADSGVDPKVAIKLKDHDFSSEDPKLKCFAKCFCEKANMCDGNQSIMLEKIENHIADDKKPMMEAAHAKCNTVNGADACDTVYQKFRCFFKEIHA